MLARLQQGILAALVLLGLGWCWWARSLSDWVVLAGLLSMSLLHAVVLALEFALAHWINRGDAAPRASAATMARAWVRESLLAPRVFLWQQPLRSNAWPDRWRREAPAATRRPGVLFIHGFVCNRGLWNHWFETLTRQDRVFAAVNLEPVFGSIDDYVTLIDNAVRQVERATGTPPLLVCHSMGGLAARAWLRAHNADTRVAHVVTIGTPHRGTWLARISRGLNGQQMQAGGGWLQQLQRDEPPQRAALFTCYYSNCDNIVFPTSSATLDGAENRFVPGVPHIALVFDLDVMREVLDRLDAD